MGEHTLFVMDLRGQVIMQKRLEYHPAACCCYPVPPVASAPGGEENLLVATHTKALLVYRGNTLAWSARTEIQPVAVKVGSLQCRRCEAAGNQRLRDLCSVMETCLGACCVEVDMLAHLQSR